MKKVTMMVIIGIMVIITNLNAEIITVDINFPFQGNYKTLQEAHDAAEPGDTIYIYPSLSKHKGCNISKQLKIIGAGYGYDYADDGVYTTKILTMAFSEGSEGSEFKGFHAVETITIRANNITIKSNYCKMISIDNGYTGIIITQNEIYGSTPIYVNSNNQVTITNNIIINNLNLSHNCISVGIYCSVLIKNNILHGKMTCNNDSNGMFINNISTGGVVFCQNFEFYNNMGNSNQFSSLTGSNNIGNINMNDVFVDYSANNYQLKDDSLAKGVGTSGDDLGVYGGSSPFVPNGALTGIPSINYLKPENVIIQPGAESMTVKIKANSGSE